MPPPLRLAPLSLLTLTVGLAAAGAQAQATPDGAAPAATPEARRSLTAVRAAERPRIDGRLDEAAWRSAPVATGFTQARPASGPPAPQATEVRVLYDDEAVYVGARMLDAEPGAILARLARRDEAVVSDWVAVDLGSPADGRTAFRFAVNARGVQRDVLVTADTREDDTWDAVWASAVARDDAGWTAEIRVPLSQLRFGLPAAGGALAWDFNVTRTIAREDAVYSWAPLDAEENRLVSRYGTLGGLRGLDPPRRVEVRPYAVSRVTRAPGDTADPFYDRNDLGASVGGDLTVGLTSDLTLSATVNPDFGQVEADPSEVNLSAFESFFPERRPFFVEGADLFDVIGPRLVYSRRIGRAPQGTLPGEAAYGEVPPQTTILGAAKLTGRPGAWQVGALAAATAAEDARLVDAFGERRTAPVEPATGYGAARAVRTFRGGQSALGLVGTAVVRPDVPDRLGFLHDRALAGGLDGRHREGDLELSGSLIGSLVAGSPEALLATQRSSARYFQRPDAGHLALDPDRTALAGWSANASAGKVGGRWRWRVWGRARSPGFEVNDLGFQTQVDEIAPGANVSYQASSATGPVRQASAGVYANAEWTFGGLRRRTVVGAFASAQLASGWSATGGVFAPRAAFSTVALRGGPALRTDGRVQFWSNVSTDPRRRWAATFRLSGETTPGTGARGWFTRPEIRVNVSPGAAVRLGVTYNEDARVDQFVTSADVGGDVECVLARIDRRTLSATLRADYALSTRLSVQVYAEPFVSAGSFSRFARVADPRARALDDRLAPLAPALGGGTYAADLDGDGAAETTFTDPDFVARRFRSTAVLRWEPRPGSALFVVWSRGQSSAGGGGALDPLGDAGALFGAPPTDTVLVKLSYWFGL